MYRVLVADDEPIERMVVSKIINKNFGDQLEIILAVNGREAVEKFEQEKCHMALLDIEMPGINGLEAAARIREKDSECSIIFLTAFDEFNYAKRAIAARALDYLLKPCVEEELVAVLEEALRIAKECQPLQEYRMDVKKYADNESEHDDAVTEGLRMHAVAENIRIYIEKHYMEDIALQDVAAAMNYSDAYFCKLFKQCFDKSFVTYLTDFRVDKAKEMLADVVINIKDISEKVGYRDSNYFAKVFKRVVGITPSEFRNKVLQIENGSAGGWNE